MYSEVVAGRLDILPGLSLEMVEIVHRNSPEIYSPPPTPKIYIIFSFLFLGGGLIWVWYLFILSFIFMLLVLKKFSVVGGGAGG